jgi:hypothetical protein
MDVVLKRMWTGFMIQVRDTVADSCDHGKKSLGSTMGGRYLNYKQKYIMYNNIIYNV